MDNIKNALPSQDSAVGRAIKTFAQAFVGFLIGLALTIWAVPGVPEAVSAYIQKNLVQMLLLGSVPSAATALIWNLFRPSVPNY